jgi:hypothetical protein
LRFAATILYFRAGLARNGTPAPAVGNRDSADLFRNRTVAWCRIAGAGQLHFRRAGSYCGTPCNHWFVDTRRWGSRCCYAIVGSLFSTFLDAPLSVSPFFSVAFGSCTGDARAWSLVDRRPRVRKKTLDSLTEDARPLPLEGAGGPCPLCPSTTQKSEIRLPESVNPVSTMQSMNWPDLGF